MTKAEKHATLDSVYNILSLCFICRNCDFISDAKQTTWNDVAMKQIYSESPLMSVLYFHFLALNMSDYEK